MNQFFIKSRNAKNLLSELYAFQYSSLEGIGALMPTGDEKYNEAKLKYIMANLKLSRCQVAIDRRFKSFIERRFKMCSNATAECLHSQSSQHAVLPTGRLSAPGLTIADAMRIVIENGDDGIFDCILSNYSMSPSRAKNLFRSWLKSHSPVTLAHCVATYLPSNISGAWDGNRNRVDLLRIHRTSNPAENKPSSGADWVRRILGVS